MEARHNDLLRRVYQADSNWSRQAQQPQNFLLVHTGGMQSQIDHPAWDSSWATPSEQTIDDLAELGLLRVDPSDNRQRSFTISMKGREVAAELLRPIASQPAPTPLQQESRDRMPMLLSARTIARLAQPFEGGSGPSHSRIEGMWLAEGVAAYLPDEGNKADRVRNGLKALRDGSVDAGGGRLEPQPEALERVASDLAAMLLAQGLVKEADVAEALEPPTHTAARALPEAKTHTIKAVSDPPSSSAPIFLVHGHDHALLYQVVRVVERATGREVTVLHEQANEGRTILEKFETHAAEASFAVVLLTADDAGGAAGASPKPRGRQNVIFELGFFFGKLGRSRVAVLLAEGVEQPSDIAGLVYIGIDSAGAWKFALARELAAGGIPVVHDRIP